jgi:hypothetical protein
MIAFDLDFELTTLVPIEYSGPERQNGFDLIQLEGYSADNRGSVRGKRWN